MFIFCCSFCSQSKEVMYVQNKYDSRNLLWSDYGRREDDGRREDYGREDGGRREDFHSIPLKTEGVQSLAQSMIVRLNPFEPIRENMTW